MKRLLFIFLILASFANGQTLDEHMGVPLANIAEINGVAIANISEVDGIEFSVIPITIGSGANQTLAAQPSGYTYIDLGNPAASSGTITTVEIYASSAMTGCKVAIFRATTGNSYIGVDSETIGNVSDGSKQTFSVSLSVQTGDYIGVYYASGQIYYNNTGDGVTASVGDVTATEAEFTAFSGETSIYGYN